MRSLFIYVISSFSQMAELQELIPDAIIIPDFIDHVREKQFTQHSSISWTVQIDFLLMDIHLLPKSWPNLYVTLKQILFSIRFTSVSKKSY